MPNENVLDITAAEFSQAVLQRSREVPVVVDFWAEWCGPCKVLGPIMEKVAAESEGRFVLAKIDVDANQELAAQFGIQSIPTVVGFRDGTPVSRFSGAVPEASFRAWLDELLPSEQDAKVDAARDAALEGDTIKAASLFREVLEEEPDHQDAGTSLASLLIAEGQPEEALIVLGKLSATHDVVRLQAAARLSVSQGTDVADLEAKLDADPSDAGARLELARALAGKGEFEPALDQMLRVVRAKGPDVDEARTAMLDVFGVLGNDHPLTVSYRKQLASALF